MDKSIFFKNESWEYAYYLLALDAEQRADDLGITKRHYTDKENILAKEWITNICKKLKAYEQCGINGEIDDWEDPIYDSILREALKEAAKIYKTMYSPAPKKRKNKN